MLGKSRFKFVVLASGVSSHRRVRGRGFAASRLWASREHVEIRDWVAPSESLQGSWGPLNDEDAPANSAVFRSVPTSSTSRSPSSTAFTPSAAPA